MSSHPEAKQRVRKYLQRQLSRNPWEASEQIVADRARVLRLSRPAAAAAGPDPGEERQRLRGELDQLRAAAFTAPLDELKQRLERLQLDGFPDLQAAAARLRTILASRSILPTLTGKPGFNADFLECFKQVLVAPARETAVLRERVINSFHSRKLRRPGVRMIRLLEKEAPALCQLERTWLDVLTRQNSQGSVPSVREFCFGGGFSWRWVAILLVFVISPIGRYYARQNHRSTQRPQDISAPQPPSALLPSPLDPDATGRWDDDSPWDNRQPPREPTANPFLSRSQPADPPEPQSWTGEREPELPAELQHSYAFMIDDQQVGPTFLLKHPPPELKAQVDQIYADFQQGDDPSAAYAARAVRVFEAHKELYALRAKHPSVIELISSNPLAASNRSQPRSRPAARNTSPPRYADSRFPEPRIAQPRFADSVAPSGSPHASLRQGRTRPTGGPNDPAGSFYTSRFPTPNGPRRKVNFAPSRPGADTGGREPLESRLFLDFSSHGAEVDAEVERLSNEMSEKMRDHSSGRSSESIRLEYAAKLERLHRLGVEAIGARPAPDAPSYTFEIDGQQVGPTFSLRNPPEAVQQRADAIYQRYEQDLQKPEIGLYRSARRRRIEQAQAELQKLRDEFPDSVAVFPADD